MWYLCGWMINSKIFSQEFTVRIKLITDKEWDRERWWICHRTSWGMRWKHSLQSWVLYSLAGLYWHRVGLKFSWFHCVYVTKHNYWFRGMTFRGILFICFPLRTYNVGSDIKCYESFLAATNSVHIAQCLTKSRYLITMKMSYHKPCETLFFIHLHFVYAFA